MVFGSLRSMTLGPAVVVFVVVFVVVLMVVRVEEELDLELDLDDGLRERSYLLISMESAVR